MEKGDGSSCARAQCLGSQDAVALRSIFVGQLRDSERRADEQRARITPAFLQLEALVVAMRELHNGESLQANCLNGLDAHGEA